MFLPSAGASGGIVIGWNSVILTVSDATKGDFSVSVDFYSKRDNFHWRCTSVYGPNVRHLKDAFWEEIRGCRAI